MGMFELNAGRQNLTIENTQKDKSWSRAMQLMEVHSHRVKDVDKDICEKLEPGEAHFILTSNRINMRTFLLWILQHSDSGRIDELIGATYSVTSNTAIMFFSLFDSGKIKKAAFIICGHLLRANNRSVIDFVAECRKRDIPVLIRNNHSKILLAQCGRQKIALMGSGNFSENADIEQYMMIDDGRVFDFYKQALLEDYSDR